MAEEKKVRIIIEADSKEAVAAAKRLEAALDNTGKKGSDAIDGISTSTLAFASAAGEFIGGIARGAFEILTSKIQQGTQALFDYTSQLEVTRKQFDSLTGSSSSTKQILDDIRKFATDKGLDAAFVTDTEKEMLRLQVSSKDTLKVLDTLSDTVASLGGDQQMTQRLTSISTEIIKSGKLSLEAINQITDAGVPAERVWKALETQTGKTRLEIMYLARDSKISSQTIFEALENFNKANNFGDAAEKQTQTFSGAINKLANILLTEGEKAFEPYFNKISEFTQQTAKDIQEKGVWATTGELIGKGIAAGTMLGIKELPEQMADYIVNRTTSLVEKLRQGNFQGAADELPGGGYASFARNIGNGILDQLGLPNGLKNEADRFKLHTATPTVDNKLTLPSPFNPEQIQKEIERQKKLIESNFKDRQQTINQNLRVEEAQINNHLRLTSQDELDYANKLKNVRQSSIKEQISLQSGYFNQQITLARGDEKTITQLTAEKNRTLKGLSTDYLLNEIQTQKQVQEIERKILEQRRQASIQFKTLQIRELSLSSDSRSFDLNRSISLGVNVQQSFEQLKSLTSRNYQQIAEITKQSYAVQLANERLTKEERVNLNKQMFLDLQDLAEKNRQKQIEIQDNQFQEQISLLEKYTARVKETYQSQSGVYGSISTFFNPETFNSNVPKALDSVFVKPIRDAEANVNLLSRKLSEAQAALDNLERAKTDDKVFKQVESSVIDLREEYRKAIETWNQADGSVTGLELSLVSLSKAMADGTAGVGAFDQAQKMLLDSQHRLQKAGLESEINLVNELLRLEKDRGNQKDERTITNLEHRLSQLTIAGKNLDLTQAAESLDQYNHSIDGLRENLQKMLSGDTDAWNGFYDQLRKQDISKQINQIKELASVQNELNKKETFNPVEANLAIATHLNQVKSVTETYSDARVAAIDMFWNGVEYAADKATSKLGIFKNLIKQLIVDFIKLATLKPLQNFFNVSGAASGGYAQSSSGVSAGNIFQKFFGGGGGAGGQGGGGLSVPGFSGGTFNFPSNNLAFAGAGSNAFRGDLGGLGFSMPTGSISNGAFNVSGGGGSNPFAGNSVSNAVNGATSQVSNYTKFKSLFSGKGNLLGSIAPMLGLGLGANLGGQSMTGQILGSIGGLAGGLLGGIGTGAINAGTMLGGIFGSGGALSIGSLSAAMSATVILAPIAGALLIGSLLLKRNAARRRDETTRDKLMVDALKGLNEIKSQMEAAKPGIDVAGLLAQTGEISANYFTQANSLKDKKTRGIAIKDGNERVGMVPPNSAFPSALTNQIYALSEGAKMKEQMRGFADERDKRIIPMFASGVYMDSGFASQYGDFKRRNGMLQGAWTGRDTLPSMLAMGEMVLNPMQINAIRLRAGFDVFAGMVPNYQPKAEMPKFAEGVNLGSSTSTNSNFAPVINFSPNLSLYLTEKEDGGFEGYLESEDGQKKVLKIYKDFRKYKD